MTDPDVMDRGRVGSVPPRTMDASLMRRAIELAERGWGRVAPNPLVGAVVAGERGIIGEGFHGEYGREHAEVQALREAGEASRGATLYVTLEPCTHYGKTPPCVDAIIESGVSRVVVACLDPNPEAEGGVDRLRAAGIEVATGVEARAAARQNAAFLWSQRTGSPYVTLKMALSLDARIAERPGTRTSISGPQAVPWVHRLRAGHGAILVGRVTAEVDDPLLTVRGEAPRVQPARIVLDPHARLSPASRLVATVDDAPLWLAIGPDAPQERRSRLEEAGARVVELPLGGSGRIDLDALLRVLAGDGVSSLLVEGGGRVAASFLDAGLVQRMHLIYSPKLLGSGGVPAFGPDVSRPGSDETTGARWRLAAHEVLGDDVMLEYELAETAPPVGGAGEGA